MIDLDWCLIERERERVRERLYEDSLSLVVLTDNNAQTVCSHTHTHTHRERERERERKRERKREDLEEGSLDIEPSGARMFVEVAVRHAMVSTQDDNRLPLLSRKNKNFF